jgi:cell division protein ZapE
VTAPATTEAGTAARGALDPDQERVRTILDGFGRRLGGPRHRGLYVYGAVGRGKTWLCDAFFDSLPIAGKRRVHVHEFFLTLHEAIWRTRAAGASEPGAVTTDAIAALLDGVGLLYFDEFHVHDAGDAALLTRVLECVFERGIPLLVTSNYPPAGLLPNPVFHDLIEPAIDLIEAHLEVVELGGSTDYRYGVPAASARPTSGRGFAAGSWVSPATPDSLAQAGLERPYVSEGTTVSSAGHEFAALRARGGELWFSFDAVCEGEAVVGDYLRWASVFDTWVIDRVPVLATATLQARQRFAHVVDVLCDQDVTLHILSDHAPSDALSGDRLPRDFERTASRLALLQAVR